MISMAFRWLLHAFHIGKSSCSHQEIPMFSQHLPHFLSLVLLAFPIISMAFHQHLPQLSFPPETRLGLGAAVWGDEELGIRHEFHAQHPGS